MAISFYLDLDTGWNSRRMFETQRRNINESTSFIAYSNPRRSKG